MRPSVAIASLGPILGEDEEEPEGDDEEGLEIKKEFVRVVSGDLSKTTEYGGESVERVLKGLSWTLYQDIDVVIAGDLFCGTGGGPFIAGVISILEKHSRLTSAYKVHRSQGSGVGAFFAAAVILGLEAEKLLRLHFAWVHFKQNDLTSSLEEFLLTAMRVLFPADAHLKVTNRLFITLHTCSLNTRLVSTYFSLEDLMSTIVAAAVGTIAKPYIWREGKRVFGPRILVPVFKDDVRDQLIIQPPWSVKVLSHISFEREVKAGQDDAMKFLSGGCSRGLSMFRASTNRIPYSLRYYRATFWRYGHFLKFSMRPLQLLVVIWFLIRDTVVFRSNFKGSLLGKSVLKLMLGLAVSSNKVSAFITGSDVY